MTPVAVIDAPGGRFYVVVDGLVAATAETERQAVDIRDVLGLRGRVEEMRERHRFSDDPYPNKGHITCEDCDIVAELDDLLEGKA